MCNMREPTLEELRESYNALYIKSLNLSQIVESYKELVDESSLETIDALRKEVEELKGEREESIERIYHYINLNKFVPAGDEELSEGKYNLWHHNAVHKERVCGEIRKLIEQEGASDGS